MSADPRIVPLAVPLARRALAAEGDKVRAHRTLGRALHANGDLAGADAAFDRAVDLDPLSVGSRLMRAVYRLPRLVRTEEDAQIGVARFATALSDLIDTVDLTDPAVVDDAVDAIRSQFPFYLSYLADDIRPLLEEYGRFIHRVASAALPEFTEARDVPAPGPDDPVRVGIPFGAFRNQSVWWAIVKGWIDGLDPARFRTTGYHLGERTDSETEWARSRCAAFVDGPHDLAAWAQLIRDDGNHVLLYPDVKSNGLARLLAGLRLAPVQVGTWGQPYTTGIPTIDWFLGGTLAEPPSAYDDYTERLVRLPGLGVRYLPRERTGADEPLARSHFGLRDSAVVYGCTQSPWKYRPHHDELIARIAERVPNSQFVFKESTTSTALTKVLRSRMTEAFTSRGLDPDDRFVFLPGLPRPEYNSLLATLDVYLDNPEWNAMASGLEVLEFEASMVTMTGSRFRGRVGTAILTQLGIPELIGRDTDDFVDIAARLGHDATARTALRKRISRNRMQAWDDPEVIPALEVFLDRVARRSPT